MAETTFCTGQSKLSEIVNKFSRAGSRKEKSLEKRRDIQTQHLGKVRDTMENSIQAEKDRVNNALEKTGYKTFDFLQRLEAQVKERDDYHYDRFNQIGNRRSEIKQKNMTETRHLVKMRRNSVEKKYGRHDSQIRLAKEKSLARIELIAEKRKTKQELQKEQDEINRAQKKDQHNNKHVLRQMRLTKHQDFSSMCDNIRQTQQ